MSLSVDIEIEATDTVVKQCTQALMDCVVTGCFINIQWVKLNNVPTCPLTNLIPVYNVDGTAYEAGMINEITDLVLHHDSHSECIQLSRGTSSGSLHLLELHVHLESGWQQ
jgi:hypothetical protein